MAIDIRATVTCSLGTLISASLSDDYLQGTGLVKCKGTVEIAGVVTPAIGTAVTFSYTKGGVTRSVPRKLRVLSSFADPFRRTTKVELGCKLTYLSDLKEPINWKAFDDPENATYTEADAEVITLPIHASSVMDQCLSELGLTASSNPLTSKFSIAKFDFSPGYVQVLGDLLVSESYCGYLDANEVLQVFSLSAEGGTGPVIDSTNIIDLGPIGVGQLPGEAVTVSYSTLKLKQPDANSESLWDRTLTINRFSVPISYTTSGGSQAIQEYRILETIETIQFYGLLTTSDDETVRVLERRVTTTKTQAAAVIGGLVTEYLSNGIGFNNGNVQMIRTEVFAYDDEGRQTFYERNDKGSAPFAHGTAGLPWVFSATDYVTIDFVNTYPIERERRFTITAGDVQQVETYLYGPWAKTIAGQQSIANTRDSFTNSAQVASYLNSVFPSANETNALHLIDHRITTEVRSAPQLAPDQADVINAQYAQGGTASNGYRTESKAELELALGSATAQRRIELSLPYPSDDVFTKTGSVYSAVASDAEAKANRYGRAQNKLLMGNRSGANFQLAPELLPSAPFAPFVVQANGLSALYRNNGTSWTMDANGVVVSTDALFWGAVGGTGTFWFPVAPGITTLPTTPAVVGGQMTVSAVVPVWNETVVASATTRTTLTVESLNYALAVLTEVPAQRVRSGLGVTSFRSIKPPSVDLTLQALTPEVRTGASAVVAATATAVTPLAPALLTGAAASVPLTAFALVAPEPEQAGGEATKVNTPATTMTLAAEMPAVVQGLSVSAPVSTIDLAALAPSTVGVDNTDPDFSSVSLLLHMDGSNNGTTFTDSSSNALTVTRSGSVITSTAAYKFGGSSAKFGSNYLSVNNSVMALGTGDFTVECWVFFAGSLNNGATMIAWGAQAVHLSKVTNSNVFTATTGSGATVTGTTAAVLNTWYHIAMTRASGTLRLFVNGIEEGTGVASTNNITTTTAYIGRQSDGTWSLLNAYLDDVRITKGVARYTANFTVPSAAFPDA